MDFSDFSQLSKVSNYDVERRSSADDTLILRPVGKRTSEKSEMPEIRREGSRILDSDIASTIAEMISRLSLVGNQRQPPGHWFSCQMPVMS